MTITLTTRAGKGSELSSADHDGNMSAIQTAVNALGTGGGTPTTRVLTAGVGLSGGGDLSIDRTFTVDLSELPTDSTGGAVGDFLVFCDASESNASNKVLVSNFITNAGITGGGGNAFGTVAVSGQSDVVAEVTNDTLTLAAGANITLTTNASTDTVTIAATGGAGGNAFSTIAVSGQSNVVADSTSDTLTFVAGTNVTLTTDASTDTVTIAASGTGAPTTRLLTAGVGLSGGGDLSADRTFTVDLNELTTDSTGGALTDFLPFVDASGSNSSDKVLVSDFIANAGLLTAGGSLRYAGITALSADANITNAHIGRLVTVSGTGVDLTLLTASWTIGDWVDFMVIGTTTVQLVPGASGVDGINQAGTTAVTLYPNTLVRAVYQSATAPKWVAGIDEALTLTANTFATCNNAGTALEARGQKFILTFAANITSAGTYPIAMHGDIPVTLNEVSVISIAGTCSYKLQKNGVDYNGHGTALGVSTTIRNTACTEALAEDNLTTLVISGSPVAVSGLTGLYVTVKGMRTGA